MSASFPYSIVLVATLAGACGRIGYDVLPDLRTEAPGDTFEAPPANVRIEEDSPLAADTITVTFAEAIDEELSHYNVMACLDSNCAGDCVGLDTAPGSPAQVSALMDGEQYIACVQGEDAAGNRSEWVASENTIIIDLTPPEPPSDVVVSADTTGTATVSYTPGSDANFLTHNVRLCPSADCVTACLDMVQEAGSEATLSDVPDGNYFACVQSVDAASWTSVWVPSSSSVLVDTHCAGSRLTNTPFANSGEATGTSFDSPFTICTPEQLQAINTKLGGYYQLRSDIDLSGFSGNTWIPIGDGSAFTGGFDGNGHTISNLDYSDPAKSNLGLFAALQGTSAEVRLTIKNLRLEDFSIEGAERVGALAGSIACIDLTGIHAEGILVEGQRNVGGLVGEISDASVIRDVELSATVVAESMAGGLTGSAYRDYLAHVTVDTNVTCTDTVTANCGGVGANIHNHPGAGSWNVVGVTSVDAAGDYAGGFAASTAGRMDEILLDVTVVGKDSVAGLTAYDDYDTEISNVTIAGTVAGNDLVGGLGAYGLGGAAHHVEFSGAVAGRNAVGGAIGTSYADYSFIAVYGTVEGAQAVGGLIGESTGPARVLNDSYFVGDVSGSERVGGIIGDLPELAASTHQLRRTYSAGAITGTTNVGGLFGYCEDACSFDLQNNFWTETGSEPADILGGGALVSKAETPGEGERATLSQLRQQSTFSGYDFDVDWSIAEGVDSPSFAHTEWSYGTPGATSTDGYRYYRVVVRSVAESFGETEIRSLEFYIDGSWRENNFVGYSGSIEPNFSNVIVSASSESFAGFAWRAFDDEPRDGWQSMNAGFSSVAPYDGGDAWLQVDFGSNSPRVEGIRLHGQGPFAPDDYRLEASNDGSDWSVVSGSESTLDSSQRVSVTWSW